MSRVVLLTPLRAGKKLSKGQRLVSLIKGRLDAWFTRSDELWEEVIRRSSTRSKEVAKPARKVFAEEASNRKVSEEEDRDSSSKLYG